MIERLFKAVIHYDASLRDFMVTMVGIFQWLDENGRRAHFINYYDNTDDEAGLGEIVVVLNDRDTAIMLKLALA